MGGWRQAVGARCGGVKGEEGVGGWAGGGG